MLIPNIKLTRTGEDGQIRQLYMHNGPKYIRVYELTFGDYIHNYIGMVPVLQARAIARVPNEYRWRKWLKGAIPGITSLPKNHRPRAQA